MLLLRLKLLQEPPDFRQGLKITSLSYDSSWWVGILHFTGPPTYFATMQLTLYFLSGRALTTFEPTLTCIFLLFRSLFSRLYRALYHNTLSCYSITEYQGFGCRHSPNKWNFTTLINLTVKQLSCSANLFSFRKCFVSERDARPFSKDPVPRWWSLCTG